MISQIEVSNSGETIAPYDLAGLVEPFRQLSQERTGTAGRAGLGLSIVKSIVEAHQGTLDFHAIPEGGLRVTVQLPLEGYKIG